MGEAPPGAPPYYKIGNERLIKVTENASRKLNSLLEKQGRGAMGALRVAVIGGGGSGLQYKMDLVDGPANRDIMVQSANVRVVVDPKSALFVSGSFLDFSDDLQKGGFKVTNRACFGHGMNKPRRGLCDSLRKFNVIEHLPADFSPWPVLHFSNFRPNVFHQ